jgi:hypothetical protein
MKITLVKTNILTGNLLVFPKADYLGVDITSLEIQF